MQHEAGKLAAHHVSPAEGAKVMPVPLLDAASVAVMCVVTATS